MCCSGPSESNWLVRKLFCDKRWRDKRDQSVTCQIIQLSSLPQQVAKWTAALFFCCCFFKSRSLDLILVLLNLLQICWHTKCEWMGNYKNRRLYLCIRWHKYILVAADHTVQQTIHFPVLTSVSPPLPFTLAPSMLCNSNHLIWLITDQAPDLNSKPQTHHWLTPFVCSSLWERMVFFNNLTAGFVSRQSLFKAWVQLGAICISLCCTLCPGWAVSEVEADLGPPGSPLLEKIQQ